MEKVPPIKELKKRCFIPGYRPGFKLKYYPPVVIYVTKLLLHLSITANQITIFWNILKFSSLLLLIPGEYIYSLIGISLFQIALIFDFTDGQIARYRKTCDKTGWYVDSFSHTFGAPFLFVCVGFGIYNSIHSLFYLIIGFVTAIFFLLRETLNKKEFNQFIKQPKSKSSPQKKSKGAIIKRGIYDMLEIEYPLSIMFFGIIFNLAKETLLLYSVIIVLNYFVKLLTLFQAIRKYDWNNEK